MFLTHQLELFHDQKVTQILFRDVKNAAELRQKAMTGEISGALLKATMVRVFIQFWNIVVHWMYFNCMSCILGLTGGEPVSSAGSCKQSY